MAARTRRPIGPADTLWLNMDRPDNLMVVESLIMLAEPLDHDRFLQVLQHRVLDRYPVFHQRPVRATLPLVAPRWEDDPGFTLEGHVDHARLPAPGGDAELQAFVDEHLGRPLPRDRALWEMHLLDGYGEGTAIYFRFHHSLADGIALTRVLLSLTDAGPGDPETDAPLGEVAVCGPVAGAAHLAVRAAGLATAGVLDAPALLRPGWWAHNLTLARQSAAVSAKLLFTTLPASPVSGMPHTGKRAVWAPPMPLAPIIEAGHRTGSTLNDVLVAALAGALATYLTEHHGVAVDIPTMVPVNLRPAGEPLPRALGNRFALVLLSLPSGLATPFERLAETKRRMDEIKDSPEPALTFGLLNSIGRTGPALERMVVDFFADKASGVTTNVPGPREARYLAGTRISAMLGWAPESGRQTLGTSIFTYDGQVHVGFKVDAELIPAPEELVTAFRAEVAALCALAGTTTPTKDAGEDTFARDGVSASRA